MRHLQTNFRWICVYPAYLNAAKTRAEGRHIAKKDCVVNPTYLEIRDVLATAGLAPIVENKKHPRERSNEIEFRGRIRVQLRNEDGTPFKEEFKSRKLASESCLALLTEKDGRVATRKIVFGCPKSSSVLAHNFGHHTRH